MDARPPAKRFIDSFAEEMGRWSARVVAVGLTLAGATLLAHVIY
jgi:hypothetical protein